MSPMFTNKQKNNFPDFINHAGRELSFEQHFRLDVCGTHAICRRVYRDVRIVTRVLHLTSKQLFPAILSPGKSPMHGNHIPDPESTLKFLV